jgi:tetratricopeptide (TPR) repeat protein
LQKATELYEKALNLRRKLYGDDHPRVATTYLNMGTVYIGEGDYDQALACFNRAWAIWKKTIGENHPNSALTQLNMGQVYFQQGNYEEALAHYNKALKIHQQVSGENSFDAGDCYGNIGSIYLELGNYRGAIDFFNRSLTILRNEVGENHPTTAVRYNVLGETYYRQGDYEQAIAFHQKDLAIQLKLHGEQHWDVARAYQELGKTYRAKHDLAQAFAHYQKALAALAPGFNSGDIYLNPPLTKSLSNVFLLSTLTLKAEALAELYARETQALKDLQMSLSTCRLAADLIDKIRRSYESEGSKLFLGKNGAQVYERAIRTALQIYDLTPEPQYLRTAFTFAEKGKAGVLAEALQASQAKNFSASR